MSDDNTSDEEEKTLSLSNENILHDESIEPLEETDNDEDSELKMYSEILPPLVVINSQPERIMKSRDPLYICANLLIWSQLQ